MAVHDKKLKSRFFTPATAAELKNYDSVVKEHSAMKSSTESPRPFGEQLIKELRRSH